jgi:hypothetical protein
MASVSGSQHVTSVTSVHALVAKAAVGTTPTTGTTSLAFFGSSSLDSTHDTVPGTAGASGFDSVVGGGKDSVSFAGKSAGVEKVVATQTVHKDGVTVHFSDGSAITVAGITHFNSGFFHH